MVIFKEQKLQIYVLMTPHLSTAITLGTHCAAGGLVISAQSKKKKELRDPPMKGEMEETL